MKISQTHSTLKLTSIDFTFSFSHSSIKCTGKINAESFEKMSKYMENGKGNYGERMEYIKNNISEFVTPIKLKVGDKVFVKKLNETVEVLGFGKKYVNAKFSRGEIEIDYKILC